jgi:hypothetical protein
MHSALDFCGQKFYDNCSSSLPDKVSATIFAQNIQNCSVSSLLKQFFSSSSLVHTGVFLVQNRVVKGIATSQGGF